MKETTVDLTPGPERPAIEPSRRAAYDAVYEVIRQRPPRSTDDYGRAAENARVWRAVEVALAAALPIERRAGREDAAKAIENADTSGWPGGRGSDVDGCQERAAEIARGVQ